jgi:hypothetical protein
VGDPTGHFSADDSQLAFVIWQDDPTTGTRGGKRKRVSIKGEASRLLYDGEVNRDAEAFVLKHVFNAIGVELESDAVSDEEILISKEYAAEMHKAIGARPRCPHQQQDGESLRCDLAAGIDPARGLTTNDACDECDLPECWHRCDNLSIATVRDADAKSVVRRLSYVCAAGRDDVVDWCDCVERRCYVPKLVDAPAPAPNVTVAFPAALHARVDQWRAATCPNALAELQAACSQLPNAHAPEIAAQVAASCRRVMSDLADVLFSASDVPCEGRAVTGDRYKNRLWAFVRKYRADVRKDAAPSQVEAVCDRIDGLHSRACKGDHSDLDAAEVQHLVYDIYSLIYDLARRYDAAQSGH